MSRFRIFLAGLALLALAATSGPRQFARMFDAQCFAGKILIVAPPFSGQLAPAGAISTPCTNAVAFESRSGTMAVASGAVFGVLSIRIYSPPFSSASVPAVTFTPPGLLHPRQLAWDHSGNLWVSDDLARKVYEFRPPFSVWSKPAAAITAAMQPMGLAIDPVNRLMFVADAGGSRTCAAAQCRIYVIRAPYTRSPVATIPLGKSSSTALAVDRRGRLFAGIGYGTFKGVIRVFVPPFVSSQRPAFSLNAGDAVMAVTFDPAQNLYAQLFSTGGVVRFNSPISQSMRAPSMRLGCPGGATCRSKNWAGLSFGP